MELAAHEARATGPHAETGLQNDGCFHADGCDISLG